MLQPYINLFIYPIVNMGRYIHTNYITKTHTYLQGVPEGICFIIKERIGHVHIIFNEYFFFRATILLDRASILLCTYTAYFVEHKV